MIKIITPAVALLAALALTGCEVEDPAASGEQKAKDKSSQADSGAAETEEVVEEEPAEEPEAPAEPESPDPDGTYTSECTYVLGDFTENTKTGYRFTADVNMKNTGNIGTVNEIKAVWFLSGGDKVVKTKTVKVAAKRSKRSGITVPVNGDQLDRHQDATEPTCKVSVSLVDIFGDVK